MVFEPAHLSNRLFLRQQVLRATLREEADAEKLQKTICQSKWQCVLLRTGYRNARKVLQMEIPG